MDTRNEFLAALRNEFSARQRADIDAAFTYMVDDRAYRKEAVEIAEEFESADWEALRSAEGGS